MALFYNKEDLALKRRLEDQPQLASRLFRQQIARGAPVEPEVPTPEQTVQSDVRQELGLPDSQQEPQHSPDLYRSKVESQSDTSEKPKFWKTLGVSMINRILPGFTKAYMPEDNSLEKQKFEFDMRNAEDDNRRQWEALKNEKDWRDKNDPSKKPHVGAARLDDERKALDIQTRYRTGAPTTLQEREWLKSYMRLEKTGNVKFEDLVDDGL